MIVLLPGIILPFFFGQRAGQIGYFFLNVWSWIFSMLTFIRYEFHGREHFRKGQSYIYVSNHTSFLDIPGLRMLIPGQFRPLAKKELKKIPIFGWIAQAATIIVDRSSPDSRKKSIDRLKAALKKGISILIFVEGTQNRTKEILQPFHDGAFRIAVDTQEPILPIVVIGAGRLMPPGTVDLKPGKIRIYVAPEIPVEGLTVNDIGVLKKKNFRSNERTDSKKYIIQLITMENNGNLKSQLSALRIISFAPIVVMVLFSGVTAFLVTTQETNTNEHLVEPFQYAVPLVMIVSLAVGHFYFKSAVGKIGSVMTLREKVIKYQQISLIRIALIEIPGLLGAIAAFLTGYLSFLAAPLLMVVVYILLRPTAFTIASDLSLSGDEKAQLEA